MTINEVENIIEKSITEYIDACRNSENNIECTCPDLLIKYQDVHLGALGSVIGNNVDILQGAVNDFDDMLAGDLLLDDSYFKEFNKLCDDAEESIYAFRKLGEMRRGLLLKEEEEMKDRENQKVEKERRKVEMEKDIAVINKMLEDKKN